MIFDYKISFCVDPKHMRQRLFERREQCHCPLERTTGENWKTGKKCSPDRNAYDNGFSRISNRGRRINTAVSNCNNVMIRYADNLQKSGLSHACVRQKFISRNHPYIGGHLAIDFKLNSKHVYFVQESGLIMKRVLRKIIP